MLNSILTQEQVNRDVGGSVILHWRPDQVAGTIIPILHQDKQTEIEQKVLESFNLRQRAKHLLEHAKCAVEIAIEQDEQTAIDWLDSASQLPLIFLNVLSVEFRFALPNLQTAAHVHVCHCCTCARIAHPNTPALQPQPHRILCGNP